MSTEDAACQLQDYTSRVPTIMGLGLKQGLKTSLLTTDNKKKKKKGKKKIIFTDKNMKAYGMIPKGELLPVQIFRKGTRARSCSLSGEGFLHTSFTQSPPARERGWGGEPPANYPAWIRVGRVGPQVLTLPQPSPVIHRSPSWLLHSAGKLVFKFNFECHLLWRA